jgi:hypothetical protein
MKLDFRALRLAAALTTLCAVSHPAFATMVSTGAIDPDSMLTSFVGYIMGLAGLIFILIFAFKGIQAANDGRHFGPAAAGLAGGVILTFGGYYILSKIGVT